MEVIFDPPLEVDLGANPRSETFNTPKEVETWIDSEIGRFEDSLPEDWARLGNFYKSIVQSQRRPMNQIKSAAQTAASKSEESIDPSTTDLQQAFNPYIAGELLHSESVAGQRFRELMSKDNDAFETRLAMGFLAAATNPPQVGRDEVAGNQARDFSAYFLGMAVYRDFIGSNNNGPEHFDKAIQETTKGWNHQLAIHQREHFDAVQEIEKAKQAITKELSRQEEEFSKAKRSFSQRIAEVEELYNEKLRTEAPAEYWSKKARNHTWIGWGLVITFFGITAFFAWFGYSIARDSISAILNIADTSLTPYSIFQLGLSRAVILIIPGFFAVWFLRILLKMGLSNLAIADDARHRVTLVATFRSLLDHRDEVLPDADRILMLQSLFRPLPGTGDEDSGPPNWFEVMMESVRKGKN